MKKGASTKNKNGKETGVKHNSKARFRAGLEENTQRSIRKPVPLILFLFSH